MRMMRWDPIAELSRLDADFGRLWFAPPSRARFEPAVDVLDEEDAIAAIAAESTPIAVSWIVRFAPNDSSNGERKK